MLDLDTLLQPVLDDAPPPESFSAVGARASVVARRRRTKRAAIVAFVVAVCAVSVTAIVVENRHETVVVAPKPAPAPIAPGPVRIGTVTRFHDSGMDMIDAFGAIWVSRPDQVARLDPVTGRVLATIPVAGESDYRNLAAGAGSIWVGETATGIVTRIDPATNRVRASIPLQDRPLVVHDLAFVDGKLWVVRPEPMDDTKGDIIAVDPATNEISEQATIPRTFGVMPGADGTHALWYMRGTDLVRFDTQSLTTKVVRHDTTTILDASAGRLWLLAAAGVIEVDERTGAQLGPAISTDPVNVTVEVGGDIVWVASQPDSSNPGYVAAYDVGTHERISERRLVGVPIEGMIAQPNALWVNSGYGLMRIAFTR